MKECKILLLEDVLADAELIERALRKGGLAFVSKRVMTREDFSHELDAFAPDLILADYQLPQFDGLSALAITHERHPDIPFIFVTGAMGEERAVETLKKGAMDYVLKDKLLHLMPAVERAFRSVEVENDRRSVERVRIEFISFVSHQLRTPLTAVRLGLERLQKCSAAWKIPMEGSEYLAQMMRYALHMSETIRTMLNVSKIEIGRMQPDIVKANIRELLSDIQKQYAPDAAQKRQTLSVQARSLMHMTDPALLKEVLSNLVSNAVKYTPDGGRIGLGAQEDTKFLTISVEDNGYGIPQDEQPQIFTKFFRGSNVLERDVNGTGLGLYLVHELISLLGGSITLQSKENSGTTFLIQFPLSV
ncbi:HAMP domain-containing histidine kinase [Candidatus Peregrinibacteria bacterium]|nr:HAMP domain-containing histidine kinase [Candidatus Peregrinibacteria bacterium]